MSEAAYIESRRVDDEQARLNVTRSILKGVALALETKSASGVRWPFELVQNAHDFGGRTKDSLVDVFFVQQDDSLVVAHNGRIFSVPELKALLSGGSSKEFYSEDTTGRFGTGFLVTHALSPRVDIAGILHTEEGQAESFSIELNRPPNEPDISKNIKETGDAFQAAKPVTESEVADKPTATFTYRNPDRAVVDVGLDNLERTIPYLYATCDRLGKFRVRRPHQETTFHRDSPPEQKEMDGFLMEQAVVSVSQGDATRKFTVLRISTQVLLDDGNAVPSSLIAVLAHNDGQWDSVHLPEPGFPKVFVQFPISETGFLPFNVVLNSRHFNPKPERDGITMNANDKALIQGALSAFPALIAYGVESGWQNAHELARLAVPERALAGESAARDELEWWESVISEIAGATAAKPIIATDAGFLPALESSDEHAAFLVPATDKSEQNPIDYDDLHRLASRLNGLHLPLKDIAPAWGNIVKNWNKTGLAITRLGLAELVEWVKEDRRAIEDLPINGDPFQWLADLLLLAAELLESVSRRPLLDRLVPDQHAQLHRVSELRIDAGIPEEVKDIADAVGIDLRAELVHQKLIRALEEPGYEPAKTLIQRLLQDHTAAEAVDRVLAALDESLPDDKAFSEMLDLPFLRASASLATYLARTDENNLRLRRCPLLAGNDTIVRLRVNAQILAPVSYWPESSKDYAELYTKNRVLSDNYFADVELNVALQPLIDRSIAIPAPLHQARRAELEGDLLREMAPGINTDGVTVRNQPFSQIAFLATEVVQRCGRNKDLATLLLDFVLNVAVKDDPTWDETTPMNGSRSGESVPLALRRSTWPYELKVRSWVPVPVGDEEEEQKTFAPTPATEANLRELLKPLWLRNNSRAIDLLHRVFGFNQLTLSLETLAPELKSEVEGNLVRLLEDPDLVKSAAANLGAVKAAVENPEVAEILATAKPEDIQKIQAGLAERQEQAQRRERNRSFGLAVQDVIAASIASYGLSVELIDRGYDYEVTALDDAVFSFEVDSYFLEVKATTSGDVRLTPMQAKTACDHPDRFVLCVVDLRGEQVKADWEPADVKPHARLVTGIGDKLGEIYPEVESLADTGKPVYLRNESELRYGVSAAVWEQGISIDEWVESLKGSR